MNLAVLTLLLLLQSIGTDESAYSEASRIIAQMKHVNERIVDMKCVFTMDIVKDRTRLPLQRTIFRYQSHPEIIHLTFETPHNGRTVVYSPATGMRVRPDGFFHFMTFTVDPLSDRAMEDAIDPITAQGFPRIVAAVDSVLHLARSAHTYSVTVDSVGDSSRGKKRIRLSLFKSATDNLTVEIDARSMYPSTIVKTSGASSAVYRFEEIEINPGIPAAEFAP